LAGYCRRDQCGKRLMKVVSPYNLTPYLRGS
jgi:hypothetical protein